jgi:hypothetical protein
MIHLERLLRPPRTMAADNIMPAGFVDSPPSVVTLSRKAAAALLLLTCFDSFVVCKSNNRKLQKDNFTHFIQSKNVLMKMIGLFEIETSYFMHFSIRQKLSET